MRRLAVIAAVLVAAITVAVVAATRAESSSGSYTVRAIFDDSGKAWTDGQLAELGQKLGVPVEKFTQASAANSYRDWFASLDESATKRDVLEIPTVFVNNTKLRADQLTPEGLGRG